MLTQAKTGALPSTTVPRHGADQPTGPNAITIEPSSLSCIPYPVSVKHRDIQAEASPRDSGVECFETPAALDINQARLAHLQSLNLTLDGKRVLDVGCGVGHLAQFFLRRGCQVVCVDGRRENIAALRARYPALEGHVADIQTDALARFGKFEVVFCYGLLYHLANPLAALHNLASVCQELLLLETLVCDHAEPILYLVDEPKTFNQALDCVACRPSPSFVTMAVNRVGFPYVYAPEQPPEHPDFRFDWRNNLDYARDGHPIRCIFVAARQELTNPRLRPLLARS
jgi:SAM-dependent methyltransferase